MSGDMPEFAMPATEAVLPALADPLAGALGPDGREAGGEAFAELVQAELVPAGIAQAELVRAGVVRGLGSWRRVVVIALVSALAGGSIPVALESLDRAAAAGSAERLRTTAETYLVAIAEGRSVDATELVPVTAGEVAPQRMLESARRIREPEVLAVRLDGDDGWVDVRYRAPYVHVTNTLAARFAEGAWQLTTSLAEAPVLLASAPGVAVSVGGVALATHRPLRFYPGLYTLDPVASSFTISAGGPLIVDGDPDTSSLVHLEVGLLPALAEEATLVAIAQVRACQALRECGVQADASLGVVDEPTVRSVSSATGEIEIDVHVVASGNRFESEWMVVALWVEPDPTLGHRWRCAPIGAYRRTPVECTT